MAAGGVIHFKFKSGLKADVVSFDGHYISVGEVKRLIAAKKGLGDVGSELELSDPSTKAVYSDESAQLPRNTSVVVRRVPGAAKKYAGGPGGPRVPAANLAATAPAAGSALPTLTGEGDEFGADPYEARTAEREAEDQLIAATLGAQEDAWRAETDRTILAQAQRGRGRGRGFGRTAPPEFYWCPHCGSRGHYGRDCPKRHDPEAQTNLKFVRAPAGIPMTMLNRTAEGALLLPSGEIASLRHNEDLFAREVGVLPTAAAADKPLLPPADAGPSAQQQQPSPPHQEEEQQQQEDQQQPQQRLAPAQPMPPALLPPPQEQQPLSSDALAVSAAAPQLAGGVPLDVGAGLFDEEEPALAEAPSLQLGLGMDLGAPAPAPAPAPTATAQPQLSSDEPQADDILRFLPALADVMPRGPVGALLRAFKPGGPMSKAEFQTLLDDYFGTSRAVAPLARAGSGSGSARAPRADDARRGTAQPRQRSSSRGRESSRPGGGGASPPRRRSRSPTRSSRRGGGRAQPHSPPRREASPRRRGRSRERSRDRKGNGARVERSPGRSGGAARDRSGGGSTAAVTDLRQLLNRKRASQQVKRSRSRSRERGGSRRGRSRSRSRSPTRRRKASPGRSRFVNSGGDEKQARLSSDGAQQSGPPEEDSRMDERHSASPKEASEELQNLLEGVGAHDAQPAEAEGSGSAPAAYVGSGGAAGGSPHAPWSPGADQRSADGALGGSGAEAGDGAGGGDAASDGAEAAVRDAEAVDEAEVADARRNASPAPAEPPPETQPEGPHKQRHRDKHRRDRKDRRGERKEKRGHRDRDKGGGGRSHRSAHKSRSRSPDKRGAGAKQDGGHGSGQRSLFGRALSGLGSTREREHRR